MRRVFHIGATVRAANPLRFFIMRTPTGIPANESVFKFDIHAVGLTTRKRRGEAAEAAFLAKASGLGFGVAKPWGDSERYDFLLDSGHGDFWRVQVKSTQRYAESRYRVKAAGWKATYTRDEIDFLVAWIIPENLWYVVPIHAFASRKNLRFYPHGGRKALYEKYREAWCLMACPRSAQIEPAQIEPDCASLNQASPPAAASNSPSAAPSALCALNKCLSICLSLFGGTGQGSRSHPDPRRGRCPHLPEFCPNESASP